MAVTANNLALGYLTLDAWNRGPIGWTSNRETLLVMGQMVKIHAHSREGQTAVSTRSVLRLCNDSENLSVQPLPALRPLDS